VCTPLTQVQRQSADTDEPALDTLSALPVYTKRSGIPGVRGDGAFAARDLLEGEVIGEYAGEIVRDAELAGARGLSRYVFDLGDGLAVDARTVWVLPGRLSALAFYTGYCFCMALLYGCTGRLQPALSGPGRWGIRRGA
jgi:hypothetical protein